MTVLLLNIFLIPRLDVCPWTEDQSSLFQPDQGSWKQGQGVLVLWPFSVEIQTNHKLKSAKNCIYHYYYHYCRYHYHYHWMTTLMYQSIPRPPIPPGQPLGIWPTLSSVQWGIWPKTRPTRWGIWLSCQNVCQRSERKRISQFFDTACEPHSQVIALVDSTWVFFLLLSFYIVISWNMPLFKAWSENKLNKKFVMADILPVHV